MNNEPLRVALDMLRGAGFEPDVVFSKHIKVTWTDHAGRRRLLVVSKSPSDRKTRQALRTTLRRLLRSNTEG